VKQKKIKAILSPIRYQLAERAVDSAPAPPPRRRRF